MDLIDETTLGQLREPYGFCSCIIAQSECRKTIYYPSQMLSIA